ncbi:uncharacterized protein LOC144180144 [Haemaphysalis longicornis]
MPPLAKLFEDSATASPSAFHAAATHFKRTVATRQSLSGVSKQRATRLAFRTQVKALIRRALRRRASGDTRARAAVAKRQRREADPQLRAREPEMRRKLRQEATDTTKAREVERQRKRRAADPELRDREAEAQRTRRALLLRPGTDGADGRFKRDFLDRSFGHSCKVCNRLWFNNNLTRIGSIDNERYQTNSITVLRQYFGSGAANVNIDTLSEYKVCATCKDALASGKVPVMSVTYGYRCPRRTAHLPKLNPVEERLMAPRLPFMSIKHLPHCSEQYGIKSQVVNVPIEVPTLVKCLPRNVPDDAAIDVHIKRRLVSKALYKRGLAKKSTVHAWLKDLEKTPPYKHVNVKIDWSRLSQFDDDDVECDDDEIEPLPEITDLEDPMQAIIALNAMSHTMVHDDVGLTSTPTAKSLHSRQSASHSS